MAKVTEDWTSIWKGTVGVGTSYGTQTVTGATAITIPPNGKLKRVKITRSTSGSLSLSGGLSSVGWNSWTTKTSLLNWSSGKKPKQGVYNSGSANGSFTITFHFEVELDLYTAVTKGNIIKATDRSQTGTSTTVGAVITDSNFSRSTLAEASTFNTKVLLK